MARIATAALTKLVALSVTSLLVLSRTGSAEIITGIIYCDKHFEFYFNDQLIQSDPVSFTPNQAVNVSFEYTSGPKTYAIMCEDFHSDSGYLYVSTAIPQMGTGVLVAEFSDGIKTSSEWKAYTVTHGPTKASISAGCGPGQLATCEVQISDIPVNWHTSSFDDSAWASSYEHSTSAVGWGRTPYYLGGKCGTIISPLTGDTASPSSVSTRMGECLNPRTTLCGGDGVCSGSDPRMIWGADLERDNKMLFRHTVGIVAEIESATQTSSAQAGPASEFGVGLLIASIALFCLIVIVVSVLGKARTWS